jgi:hypothetical protein
VTYKSLVYEKRLKAHRIIIKPERDDDGMGLQVVRRKQFTATLKKSNEMITPQKNPPRRILNYSDVNVKFTFRLKSPYPERTLIRNDVAKRSEN